MTKPWTDDEVEAMVRALREGATYSEVSAMLGRSRGAIAGCIRRYTRSREALPVLLPDSPAPEPAGVSLLGLKPGMCKWPVAEVPSLTGGFAFCAAKVPHPGAVYCMRHQRIAMSAPREKRQAAA
jgi:hypothetical protein